MTETRPNDFGINPVASRWIFLGLMAMIGLAVAALVVFGPTKSPPPADIAKDPLLVIGRDLYLSRCVSCHGERGRGDGPLAKGLSGPKPRDFSGEAWRHGDQPEQAIDVVARGVPNTSMPGWSSSYSPSEIRGVTAYVYYLAGKPVPEALRTSP